MSLLVRFIACLGCLVGLCSLARDLVPTTSSRFDSESSASFVPPSALPAVLLARSDVQCELGIDDAQSLEVHEWLLAVRDQAKANCPDLKSMFIKTEKDLDAYQQLLREFFRREVERSDLGLSEVLNAEQLRRLRQLSLQREGLRAFDRREVISCLELTPHQREQIEQLSGLGLSPHLANDVASRCREELANVLTDKQRETWHGLIGEVFVFDHAVPFGFEYEIMRALTAVGDQTRPIVSSSPQVNMESGLGNQR